MDRRQLIRALAALAIAAQAPVRAAETRPLKLGIMPFNSTLALFRTHQPLRQYLQEQLGRPIELFTSADYVTFLNASLAGEFDLLITGPHFGVMCLSKGYDALFHYRAVLQPILVVRKDGSIGSLDDLHGMRIGLSSRLSISSIGGVKWLADRGLQVGRDYQLSERATHGAAVAAVAVGDLDAALTTYTPLRQMPEDVRARISILPLEMKVPHLMTLAHSRLGKLEIEKVRKALRNFPNTPEGQAFFKDTGYEGYESISDEDLKALVPFIELTRKLLAHNQ